MSGRDKSNEKKKEEEEEKNKEGVKAEPGVDGVNKSTSTYEKMGWDGKRDGLTHIYHK